MFLHKNKEAFQEVITATSYYMSIPEEQIEKDYFVSYLLEHLVREIPTLVFKGGTSLSKCYGIIKRFSEDIDLHFDINRKPTASERIKFKESIEKGIRNAELILNNPDDIKHRYDHNIYEVGLEQITGTPYSLKKDLIIETYVPIKTFPCEKKEVRSYILDYLMQNKEFGVINQFELNTFYINVQSLERTYIDKIFAICDYCEMKKINRNSRHLYDIHKIFHSIKFNKEEFQLLFESVRKERQRKLDRNVTSIDGYDIAQALKGIIKNDVFKKDYQDITRLLLFEEVSYEEVKNSVQELLKQGLIPSV